MLCYNCFQKLKLIESWFNYIHKLTQKMVTTSIGLTLETVHIHGLHAENPKLIERKAHKLHVFYPRSKLSNAKGQLKKKLKGKQCQKNQPKQK